MELSDLTGLLLAAALIGASLGSIYFVMRKIGWNSTRGSFLDAFLVWLAWADSNLWICFIFAIVDLYTHILPMILGIPLLVLLSGFVGSTSAVAVLIRYLLKGKAESYMSIIWQAKTDEHIELSALRISFAAVGSATMTFLLFVSVLFAFTKIYNYYYPPPPFGIYDIK